MTLNQIRNAERLETARANRAGEAETHRANVARESENIRSNLAREIETNRHNLVTEAQGARNLSILADHYKNQDSVAQQQADTAEQRRIQEGAYQVNQIYNEKDKIEETKRHNKATVATSLLNNALDSVTSFITSGVKAGSSLAASLL